MKSLNDIIWNDVNSEEEKENDATIKPLSVSIHSSCGKPPKPNPPKYNTGSVCCW